MALLQRTSIDTLMVCQNIGLYQYGLEKESHPDTVPPPLVRLEPRDMTGRALLNAREGRTLEFLSPKAIGLIVALLDGVLGEIPVQLLAPICGGDA